MEINITSNGNSNPISLKVDDANFKVSIVSVLSGGYDGKYTIQYSPDMINWIDHETAKDVSTNACNNLFSIYRGCA